MAVQLSASATYLHSIDGVFVIKHQRLLDQLVVSFQLVDVGLVSNNDMLKLLQLGHLVLQCASNLQRAAPNFLLGHTGNEVFFKTNLHDSSDGSLILQGLISFSFFRTRVLDIII